VILDQNRLNETTIVVALHDCIDVLNPYKISLKKTTQNRLEEKGGDANINILH